MKKILFLLIIVIIGYSAWYFVSPLFIDTVVEEDFPGTEEMAETEMDKDKMMEMMKTLTEEDVAALSENERMEMKETMEEMAKTMPDTVQEEAMPEEKQGPELIATGQFKDADSFHKGSGSATVYTLADGSHILRFENFSVTNGPALSVFLTKNSDGSKDAGFVDLGPLKGNKGNQNYVIPPNIDLSQYKGVLIYCVPFSVPFSIAPLL